MSSTLLQKGKAQGKAHRLLGTLMISMLIFAVALALLPAPAFAYQQGDYEDTYYVDDAADLAKLIKELPTNTDNIITVYHTALSVFNIDRDITIPKDVDFKITTAESVLTVNANCTLTNNGNISTDAIRVAAGGTFINNNYVETGKMTIEGKVTVAKDAWLYPDSILITGTNGELTCAGTIGFGIYSTSYDNGEIQFNTNFADYMELGDSAKLSFTGDGNICWDYFVRQDSTDTTIKNILADITKLKTNYSSYKQTSLIRLGTCQIKNNLTIPDDVQLLFMCETVDGERSDGVYICEGATLTTNDITIIEGYGEINGTWVAKDTVWLTTLYDGCSLRLGETGSLEAPCIQVDWFEDPFSVLPGFDESAFDEPEEYDGYWLLFFKSTSGDGSTDKPVAHQHEWDNGTVTTPATCKDTGVMTYKCTVTGCTQTKTEAIPKTNNHTSDGVTDCTKDSVCTVCNTVLRKAGEHVWNAGKITTAPTCNTKGVKTYTCTSCPATKTEAVATQHSYVDTVTAPTCTSKGYTVHTCSKCNHFYNDNYVEALGHELVSRKVFLPTCTESGYTQFACTRCDYTNKVNFNDQGDKLEPLGHDWKLTLTDTTTGLLKCTRCDEAHKIDLNEEFKELTCQHELTYTAKDNVLHQYCTKCSHHATATLSVTDKTFTGQPITANVTYSQSTGDLISDIDTWKGDKPDITYSNNIGPGTAYAYLTKGKVKAELKFSITATTPVKVSKYVRGEKYAETFSTLKGARYFRKDKIDELSKATEEQKRAMVDSLLAVSMKNADEASYTTVSNRIYDLLYKSTYRPTQLGGNKENIKNWPIQNKWTKKPAMKVTDNGMGYTVKWDHKCYGCMSYAAFSSEYVYRNTGKVKNVTAKSAAGVRSSFRNYLDPGEQIRYYTKYWHSIVYIGESADGQGFYFTSYGGGASDAGDHHNLDIGYFTYEAFYKLNKNKNVMLYNTNGGSYYAGTAKAVSNITTSGSVKKIKVNCPVEVVITRGDEVLDSRLLADSTGMQYTWGRMLAYGDIGSTERHIEIELYEAIDTGVYAIGEEPADYDIQIIGTDYGTMDLTVTYIDADGAEDTRTFKDVPITSSTTASLAASTADTEAQLTVISDTCKDGDVWVADTNETVDEPTGMPAHVTYDGTDGDYNSNGPDGPEDSDGSDSSGGGSSGSSGSSGGGSSSGSNSTIDTPGTSGIAFTDVPESAYFAKAVKWAVKNGITSGTTPTLFAPDEACTRAQAVTFLWRAAGCPKATASTGFTDVPAGAYYAEAVQWAVSRGITQGTTATTFGPDETCTRAQIVTLLHRMQNTVASGTNPFTDVADDAYYRDAVLAAVAAGITTGTTDTTFEPDSDCTRAQIVTFLYRAMGK